MSRLHGLERIVLSRVSQKIDSEATSFCAPDGTAESCANYPTFQSIAVLSIHVWPICERDALHNVKCACKTLVILVEIWIAAVILSSGQRIYMRGPGRNPTSGLSAKVADYGDPHTPNICLQDGVYRQTLGELRQKFKTLISSCDLENL